MTGGLVVPPGPALSYDPTRVILAVSGGGFRGLYSALVLAGLQSYTGRRPWDSCIDLFVGTSIGSAVAAGLALGHHPDTLAQHIREIGPKVFKRWLPPFQQLRRLGWAPYNVHELERAIEALLGSDAGKPLNEIDQPLLIPAVAIRERRAHLFKSRGLAPNDASRETVLEAVLASTAAPTYFPPRIIKDTPYADGGLIANAPDLVAVSEAVRHLSYELEHLHVLSVGTAGPHLNSDVRGGDGSLAWVVQRRIVQTTLAAQERLAVNMCAQLLGARYHRFDIVPYDPKLIAAIIDMDNASPAAAEALATLAGSTVKDAYTRENIPFFNMIKDHRAQHRLARQ